MEERCITCDKPMEKTFVTYKGIKFDALHCPKCKRSIFTEELAMDAIHKLEARRLLEEYQKTPMKIGRSWGMTFPKEIAEVFNLNNPKTKFKLVPKVREGKIEIRID